MSIQELVDIFKNLDINESQSKSETISKIINPSLRDVIDFFNLPLDTPVYYFFIENKKYILRATKIDGKTFLVYVFDEESGHALFSQTPGGIIRMVCQKFHPKFNYNGRSWQCIFCKGRSLLNFKKTFMEEKMMDYLWDFEDVEDVFIEEIDGRKYFVVETNKSKEELKKMDVIFDNENIIAQPPEEGFKYEYYIPPLKLYLPKKDLRDKYICTEPYGTLGCFCIDVVTKRHYGILQVMLRAKHTKLN